MQRRKILLTGLGMMGALLPHQLQAQSKRSTSLTLTWLGHMSFLFQDGNRRILSHPFKSIGCNAQRSTPSVPADVVLVSSLLLDEGFTAGVPESTPILRQPGAYALQGLTFQGIRMAHDRVQGRRFGFNVAWLWQQAGIRLLHLGGAAAPFLPEERILMGRPDVLMVPVGGGAKAYDALAAKEAIMSLNPKIVIPTQYRSGKVDESCDLDPLAPFLALFTEENTKVLKGNTLTLSAGQLPEQMTIMVFGNPAPPKQASPKVTKPPRKK